MENLQRKGIASSAITTVCSVSNSHRALYAMGTCWVDSVLVPVQIISTNYVASAFTTQLSRSLIAQQQSTSNTMAQIQIVRLNKLFVAMNNAQSVIIKLAFAIPVSLV